MTNFKIKDLLDKYYISDSDFLKLIKCAVNDKNISVTDFAIRFATSEIIVQSWMAGELLPSFKVRKFILNWIFDKEKDVQELTTPSDNGESNETDSI